MFQNCSSLTIVEEFSYSATVPMFNCIKWSSCNKLIGLNLCDKLIIYRMNINHSTNKSMINLIQLNQNHLKLMSTKILPQKHYNFNVGNLKDAKNDISFMNRPKKPLPYFNYFDFSPSIMTKCYNLIGTITDDYCFILYIQLGISDWKLIRNLSLDLNKHYNDNEWKNSKTINYSEYLKRIHLLSTTSFCWDPDYEIKDQSVEYRLYSTNKNGDIFSWRIKLYSEMSNDLPKCEVTIEQTISTDLSEIVSISKIFKNSLLMSSIDGQVVVYNLNLASKISQLNVWPEQDNLPCHSFCFENIDENHIEIAFHKIDKIIYFRLFSSNDSTIIERIEKFHLKDNIELLSIFDYGGKGKYCATMINSSKIISITLPVEPESSNLTISDIKCANISFSSTDSIFGIDCSTNRLMMAVVSSNNSFCFKSNTSQNVNVYICSRVNMSSVLTYLEHHLTSEVESIRFYRNIDDYLFLCRYYLIYGLYIDEMKRLVNRLLENTDQLNPGKTWKDVNERLWFLKLVRFILKRYCELTLLYPKNEKLDTNINERADKLRQLIERQILNQTIQLVLNRMASLSQPLFNEESFFTCEQLASLFNIDQLDTINISQREIIDRARSLVQCTDIFKLARYASLVGSKYLNQVSKSKSLLDHINKCSYCEISIASNVQWDTKCGDHPLDVCANSLLIIDPLSHDIQLCAECFESKLMSPQVWPSPNMFPFFNCTIECCIFCL